MDVCFTVVALLMLLLLLAAVGHGLWLALAAVARPLLGRPSEAPARERREQCAGCRNPAPPGAARCEACGLHLRGATAAELRDLDAAARQLRRFLDAGALGRTTFERLRGECVKARRRLLGRPPAAEKRGRRGEGEKGRGGVAGTVSPGAARGVTLSLIHI